ncbi:MAG: RDD family protein [Arachnia sp.]
MAEHTHHAGAAWENSRDERWGSWLRRGVSYLIGVVVPWSLVYQMMATLIVGRSDPENDTVAWWLTVAAFLVVIGVTAFFAKDGQTWSHRLLRLQVCDLDGRPASRRRIALRGVAHVVDLASALIGFLWPLWDSKAQTFADKMADTRVRRV